MISSVRGKIGGLKRRTRRGNKPSSILPSSSPLAVFASSSSAFKVHADDIQDIVEDPVAFQQLQLALRSSGGMTDVMLKQSLPWIVWQVLEDMDRRRDLLEAGEEKKESHSIEEEEFGPAETPFEKYQREKRNIGLS